VLKELVTKITSRDANEGTFLSMAMDNFKEFKMLADPRASVTFSNADRWELALRESSDIFVAPPLWVVIIPKLLSGFSS